MNRAPQTPMKNIELEAADCGPTSECAGRRQFLTRSVVGGLAIALGGANLLKIARADDDGDKDGGDKDGDKDAVAAPDAAPVAATAADAKDYELVIKPSDHPELAKVGGFVMLDTKVGKITVARVSETEFAAVGAVCTHKGGPVQYNPDGKQFFCPWHGSKFALDGAVVKGPAKVALPSYKEETAAVIKLS